MEITEAGKSHLVCAIYYFYSLCTEWQLFQTGAVKTQKGCFFSGHMQSNIHHVYNTQADADVSKGL